MNLWIKAVACGVFGVSEREKRVGNVRMWVQRATVRSEGHPRGNGDGPLTTNRSSTTRGA